MSLPKSIFVWTLDDVVTVVFIGLFLVIGALILIGKLWDRVQKALFERRRQP